MRTSKRAVLQKPQTTYDPHTLVGQVGGRPQLDFFWKEVSGKMRIIGSPNKPMEKLHELFGNDLRNAIRAMGKDGDNLIKFPSAMGCVRDSNPQRNAEKHAHGKHFYITDLHAAYPSVDIERLTVLIVFIMGYSEYRTDFKLEYVARNELAMFQIRGDPLYHPMFDFLQIYFAGKLGKGLAVGGPLSPFLINLYCEMYIDSRMREWCRKYNGYHANPEAHPADLREQYEITYTRYVDDLVFSRGSPCITPIRKGIRKIIQEAGFLINHRKSKVLSLEKGTVFITKQGLRAPENDEDEVLAKKPAILVFPQSKRRHLHGLIGKFLAHQADFPLEKSGNVVKGYVAQFLHYYKSVAQPTATDAKTLGLCRKFEIEWAKYRKGPAPRRDHRRMGSR